VFIAQPQPSPDSNRIVEATAKEMGFEMNLTRAWAWRPDVYEAFAALRSQLTSRSKLSKRELAVMVCATASELGDSYCALAWGNTLTKEASPSVAAAVIAGQTDSSMTARDRALATWARKVVANPNATTAGDVIALREAGFTDLEVFEATAFVAFRLAFSSVNDALGVKPDRQLRERLPSEVASAVTFGRGDGPAWLER
jgi:uncharacterized peroxidase-related enzyme